MDKNEIKKLAVDCGFKLTEKKDGSLDLDEYVYVFSERLMKYVYESVTEGILEAVAELHETLKSEKEEVKEWKLN